MSNLRVINPDEVLEEQDRILHADSTQEQIMMPTDNEVIDALVLNQGVITRVTTKLGITQEHVLAVITKNPRALSTRLRTVLMLKAFSTLVSVDTALQANVHELSPDMLGRTYAATLAAFSNLAQQFEEKEVADTDDDAGAAKQALLDKLTRMGKREELESAQYEQEATG